MEAIEKSVRYNPFVKGFYKNPYDQYKALREQDPMHASFMGAWVVTRYEDVREAINHPLFSSDLRSWKGFEKRYKNKELIAWMLTHSVLNVDDPTHKPLRSFLKQSFMPKALSDLAQTIGINAKNRLDNIEQMDVFDLISEYALAVPLDTINDIFGIPEEDREQAKEWSTHISNLIEPLPDISRLKTANQSIKDFSAYLKNMLLTTEASGIQEGFLGKIIHTPLKELAKTDDYVLPNLILMFAAAHETTVNLIGNGLYALLQHPEQLQHLRKNPELMDVAIEEMLRYDSPQQLAWRSATEKLVLGGQVIQKGEQVMLLLGAANRDPAHFENPNTFDITRKPNQHLSFGQGKHNCMGSWMARMQGKIALKALLERFSTIEMVGEEQWLENISFRGMSHFPLRVGK